MTSTTTRPRRFTVSFRAVAPNGLPATEVVTYERRDGESVPVATSLRVVTRRANAGLYDTPCGRFTISGGAQGDGTWVLIDNRTGACHVGIATKHQAAELAANMPG
jgi:hypothetical protein